MIFQLKCTNFRDFYLVKKGPKNLGIGKPPPPTFGQCPKVSDFFIRIPSLNYSVFIFYKDLRCLNTLTKTSNTEAVVFHYLFRKHDQEVGKLKTNHVKTNFAVGSIWLKKALIAPSLVNWKSCIYFAFVLFNSKRDFLLILVGLATAVLVQNEWSLISGNL